MKEPISLAQLRDLIARDELPAALEQLRQMLADSPRSDEAVQQSGRFANLRQQIRLGTLSHAEATLTQNQIRTSLLELLGEIEARAADSPAIRQEVERALSISHSKNVVGGGSITAQTVDIGDKTEIHHHYGDKKIPRALTSPPFLTDVFLGREEDLEAIRQKLFSGENLLLLVNGQGGVGKTSVAAKYYDRYHSEYRHTAWVLSERGIVNALLDNLAEPLGLHFAPEIPREERLEALLRVMANLDRPCLLVIDNANDLDDLKENYLHLRRCSQFHLLLTTRITQFEQAQSHPIQGLPLRKALELFRHYYPKLQVAEEP